MSMFYKRMKIVLFDGVWLSFNYEQKNFLWRFKVAEILQIFSSHYQEFLKAFSPKNSFSMHVLIILIDSTLKIMNNSDARFSSMILHKIAIFQNLIVNTLQSFQFFLCILPGFIHLIKWDTFVPPNFLRIRTYIKY